MIVSYLGKWDSLRIVRKMVMLTLSVVLSQIFPPMCSTIWVSFGSMMQLRMFRFRSKWRGNLDRFFSPWLGFRLLDGPSSRKLEHLSPLRGCNFCSVKGLSLALRAPPRTRREGRHILSCSKECPSSARHPLENRSKCAAKPLESADETANY